MRRLRRSVVVAESERSDVVRIADDDVDPTFDRELRELLAACFTKPGDEIFRTRRYYEQPPSWRWSIRFEDRLVAHVAAHDLAIRFGVRPRLRTLRVLGIAEVCVAPGSRGVGLVPEMLGVAHAFGVERGFDLAMLFGREAIYGSSGYHATSGRVNVIEADGTAAVRRDALLRPLASGVPEGDVILDGPAF